MEVRESVIKSTSATRDRGIYSNMYDSWTKRLTHIRGALVCEIHSEGSRVTRSGNLGEKTVQALDSR